MLVIIQKFLFISYILFDAISKRESLCSKLNFMIIRLLAYVIKPCMFIFNCTMQIGTYLPRVHLCIYINRYFLLAFILATNVIINLATTDHNGTANTN